MDATEYTRLRAAAHSRAQQLRRDALNETLDALGRAVLRLLPHWPTRKEKACPSST